MLTESLHYDLKPEPVAAEPQSRVGYRRYQISKEMVGWSGAISKVTMTLLPSVSTVTNKTSFNRRMGSARLE